MEPLRTLRNQFLGINPHLHSRLQEEGGWSSFHTLHISHLMTALKALLLPMGYTADLESSLQRRREDDSRARPKSDFTIYDLLPQREAQTTVHHAVMAVPLTQVLLENPVSEIPYRAVVIYPASAPRRERGKPVAWLELLSPTNKESGEDAALYVRKRGDLLASGLVFIELDYLHETPPTLPGLPNYTSANERDGAPAHSYRIAILDPRPNIREGQAYISEFDVDAPIPTMTIPLTAGDQLEFDFGVPYRKSYEEGLYGLEVADYRALPTNLNRYRRSDQARIVTRMIAVREAAARRDGLQDAPQPLEVLPLETAMERLNALTL